MTTQPAPGRKLTPEGGDRSPGFKLGDGSRVGVVGGGPAGSYFTYFLLDTADRQRINVRVDIYEPRDFFTPGPGGCNMCGGVISESLIQTLDAEGIHLPSTVVQRGIDSYVLHMDVGNVCIDTPHPDMRIAAVHRGAGPQGLVERKWESFDGLLQLITRLKGAQVIRDRVTGIAWEDGVPLISTKSGTPQRYDLLAVAVGVNSAALKLFDGAGLAYRPPGSAKTLIREYYLGAEAIETHLGSSMHIFLLDIPGLRFAAAIPKGDYVTIVLLGKNIDQRLSSSFLNSPEVKQCMPPHWEPGEFACHCAPRMNVHAAIQPFDNRIVFIGDCGITRLYKDGIGGAYRAARAAAMTAILHGVSAEDFRQHYWPTVRAIEADNTIGRVIYTFTRQIKKRRFARQAVLRMAAMEQGQAGKRRMSMILWDMFTGSASYQDIILRSLHPAHLARFVWNLAVSVWPFGSSGHAQP